MGTRWKLMGKVSPSGRTLYKCAACGRESYAPDKTCDAGCVEPANEPRRGTLEIDSGPAYAPRASGCVCQWEAGDSLCPVHPTCENCGEPSPEHAGDCGVGRGANA